MTVIKIKNSNVSGRIPASGDIEIAELGLNIADKKLYSKDAAGAVFEIGVAGDIPSGIAPPSAGNNVGDLYYDTAVGRLLYWDGSGWQAVVKASGDNFTGDVTLGAGTANAEKITLEPSGESTFLGDMIVHGDAQLNVEGVKIQSGLITTCGSNGANSVFRAKTTSGGDSGIDLSAAGRASFAGDLYVGTTWAGLAPTTTPPITLSADGSAEFSGYVEVAGDPASSEVGCRFEASGIVSSGRTDSSQAVFAGYTAGSPSRTFQVLGEGTTQIGGTLPASPNISLNSDGSLDVSGTELKTFTVILTTLTVILITHYLGYLVTLLAALKSKLVRGQLMVQLD